MKGSSWDKEEITKMVEKIQSKKRRDQQVDLILDKTSPRPPSSREVITLNFSTNKRGGQR